MRILLSGYYGHGNLGDEAILAGLAPALQRQGHRITVLSGRPASTRTQHGVEAAHHYRGVLPALLGADTLISGGGGLLQDKTSRRSLQYYLGLVNIARRLGKRVAVYGQSVGPLSTWGRTAVERALSGIPVAVRDEASQALLAEMGLEAHLVADAALLLPPPASLPRQDRVLLIPRGGYPEIAAALADTARALAEQGMALAATAVQPGEDRSDLAALNRAAPRLEILEANTPQQLLAHIAASGYVLSGRLHGLILAAVAGVGFAGLIYDPKVAAFLAEAGAPAFALPVDRATLLRVALERRGPDPVCINDLKTRAVAGLEWLQNVLV